MMTHQLQIRDPAGGRRRLDGPQDLAVPLEAEGLLGDPLDDVGGLTRIEQERGQDVPASIEPAWD